MALLDAVGRHLGVPSHELLGERVRDEVPIAWWCIDMPPADLASEAERAVAKGYTALKMKGRPWFDLDDQLTAIETAVGDVLEIGIDFNFTLLDADDALPILKELTAYDFIDHFEEPLPRSNATGNKELTEALEAGIFLHYDSNEDPDRPELEEPVPTMEALCRGICDGFVMADSTFALPAHDAVMQAADTPFRIQMCGSTVTAAHAVQFASVCAAASVPIVTADQIYAVSPLASERPVAGGHTPVPTEPGIGYEIDRDILDTHRTEIPEERPSPARIIQVVWPDGRRLFVKGGVNSLLRVSWKPDLVPYFEPGAQTTLIPDDGSDAWRRLERTLSDGYRLFQPHEDVPAIATQ
jgi:hypothetical protein